VDSVSPPVVDCEVGVIDQITFVNYDSLKSGGIVPVVGTAQSGFFMRLMARSQGLGTSVVIDVTSFAPSQDAGSVRVVPLNPDRLQCYSDGWCYSAPLAVNASSLVEVGELDGLAVTLQMTVTGEGRTCTDVQSGVLKIL
jgi:hypothetical protein